ncbi:MAG TPA: 16S rRNA (cytosine(1402)-N(4))-methyltransferase RsmH [Aquificales bacterium]|uniref:Ribosomal RNA small subunit methyltransferase H n=1 Tax=Aquifex aeolicus TaxID=63363 RepID=A0A9D0YQK9_AQUAO|nr:16S rRNA (cytosine(1402)-N(4))-methyltransferase RsmH [Aquificales bacterium]HIP98164.1 16S rRNA (cytosine(1402)-N(4))-methyltransferase RsmH [Aquifex aeolicus]
MQMLHFPVLLKESVELLTSNGGKVYVDATVGLGGHAYHILSRREDIYLIGIDKDPYALEESKKRLSPFEGRFSLYQADYEDIEEVLKAEGIERVDGILMDLGVSMLQLKTPERGFSFKENAPLDMRMDPKQKLTAYYVVNRYKERDLVRIIKEYGEERFAYRIAKAIVGARRKNPIETTKELADIVEKAIPKGFYKKIHPATKTFQAIRIEVNRELWHLKNALLKIPHLLNPKGRIAVISFHSLEDRIVKQTFRYFEKEGLFELLTKKPITPSEEEIKQNPPSRSAKLRVAQRV